MKNSISLCSGTVQCAAPLLFEERQEKQAVRRNRKASKRIEEGFRAKIEADVPSKQKSIEKVD